MLLSRGLRTVKTLKNHCKTNVHQPGRMSSHEWYYRKVKLPSKRMELLAELTQGFAWWWMLWHLWTEPRHITGEYPWPEASKWSDEELGIPRCVKVDDVPEVVCSFYKKKPDEKKCD